MPGTVVNNLAFRSKVCGHFPACSRASWALQIAHSSLRWPALPRAIPHTAMRVHPCACRAPRRRRLRPPHAGGPYEAAPLRAHLAYGALTCHAALPRATHGSPARLAGLTPPELVSRPSWWSHAARLRSAPRVEEGPVQEPREAARIAVSYRTQADAYSHAPPPSQKCMDHRITRVLWRSPLSEMHEISEHRRVRKESIKR